MTTTPPDAPTTPEAPVPDRPSLLHDEHVALGATLTSFAGWLMPLRYTSDLAEHTAVRTAAGLFDLSHMAEIVVEGPGAATALDHALVGRASAIEPDRAKYTMLVADDGSVLDDLVVYRTGSQRFLVVANAANHDVALAELTVRAAGYEASVRDESDETALVAVQGPAALAVVLGAGLHLPDDDVTALRYYAALPVTIGGEPALLARTGYTGEDGFEFFVPAGVAAGLWRALLAAGAAHGLAPAGLSARDSLRLEAGMPLYGHELDRTTTPFDAGLGRVVVLDKTGPDGEPIETVGGAALAARRHAAPARVLVGLEGLTRRAARAGYPVHAGAADDDPRVGTVTSGAPSPTLGHPIAMAYVTPEVAAAGTELAVDVRGRREPVRVVELPFYRRPR
jgi:aminomethyltransferase